MGVIVAQRSQSVELFLPCSVPKGELDVGVVNEDVVDVVLEDRGFTEVQGSAGSPDAVECKISLLYCWEVSSCKDIKQ